MCPAVVIGPTGAVKVLVATKPVDLRKGAAGLAALVHEQREAILSAAQSSFSAPIAGGFW